MKLESSWEQSDDEAGRLARDFSKSNSPKGQLLFLLFLLLSLCCCFVLFFMNFQGEEIAALYYFILGRGVQCYCSPLWGLFFEIGQQLKCICFLKISVTNFVNDLTSC